MCGRRCRRAGAAGRAHHSLIVDVDCHGRKGRAGEVVGASQSPQAAHGRHRHDGVPPEHPGTVRCTDSVEDLPLFCLHAFTQKIYFE